MSSRHCKQSLSGYRGVNTMLMMLGAAKPIFRLPYTFVPRPGTFPQTARGSPPDHGPTSAIML